MPVNTFINILMLLSDAMKYLVQFTADGILFEATLSRIRSYETSHPSKDETVECRFRDGQWYEAKVIHQIIDMSMYICIMTTDYKIYS